MKYHTLNAPAHSVLEEAHQIKPERIKINRNINKNINGHSNASAVLTVTTPKVYRNDSAVAVIKLIN